MSNTKTDRSRFANPGRETMEAYAALRMTASEIARRHGVGVSTARRWLAEHDLQGYLRMGRPTELNAPDVIREVVAGASLGEVGRRRGISRQAVHQWVQRNYGSLEGMGESVARESMDERVLGMRM